MARADERAKYHFPEMPVEPWMLYCPSSCPGCTVWNECPILTGMCVITEDVYHSAQKYFKPNNSKEDR